MDPAGGGLPLESAGYSCNVLVAGSHAAKLQGRLCSVCSANHWNEGCQSCSSSRVCNCPSHEDSPGACCHNPNNPGDALQTITCLIKISCRLQVDLCGGSGGLCLPTSALRLPLMVPGL